MEPVSFAKFDKIYQKHVAQIYAFWSSDMQNSISKHNYTWRNQNFDFFNYLKLSSKRYYIAYKSFYDKGLSFCDIGGFYGVFPLTLKELGYKVAFTEALKYYDKAFNNMFKYISNAGIMIIDADPFEADFNVSEKFDIISIMAVLEHYPHSPKLFFDNVLGLLNKPGDLYVEAPNIAYYYKRMMLLFGKTPLTNIKDIFNSEIPFIGHHHEYTFEELQFLLSKNNLTIEKVHYYTYSYNFNYKFLLKNPLSGLIQSIFPSFREIISVNAEYK